MTSIDIGRPARTARSGGTTGPRLTGWKVLGILVAFFATVATVNGIMIHYALSTFPGVEDDQAYEHGLHYNDTLAASFVLKDMNGATVTEGNQTGLTAYNVTSSPYATLAAQQDADKRAAQDIAERIRLDLAAFFRQRR